jgi:hypothetical protein
MTVLSVVFISIHHQHNEQQELKVIPASVRIQTCLVLYNCHFAIFVCTAVCNVPFANMGMPGSTFLIYELSKFIFDPQKCNVYYTHLLLLLLLLLLLFIHYLQLDRHPVAGVVTCYISMDYGDFTLKFRYGGLHEKHVVWTWNCREPRETKKNLRRDGWSQVLPGTYF